MTESRLEELEVFVSRFQAGDPTVHQEFFEFTFERFERLTRKMLKGFPGVKRWEETGDVWQNASLRLWNSLQKIEPADSRHLLTLTALHIRRELIDLTRRYYGPHGMALHHVSPKIDDATGDTPPLDPAAGTTDPGQLAQWTEFHQSVDKLPEQLREVFDLIWYQGLNQADAARMLSISLRTVKRRWQAARLALHDSLGLPNRSSND